MVSNLHAAFAGYAPTPILLNQGLLHIPGQMGVRMHSNCGGSSFFDIHFALLGVLLSSCTEAPFFSSLLSPPPTLVFDTTTIWDL